MAGGSERVAARRQAPALHGHPFLGPVLDAGRRGPGFAGVSERVAARRQAPALREDVSVEDSAMGYFLSAASRIAPTSSSRSGMIEANLGSPSMQMEGIAATPSFFM